MKIAEIKCQGLKTMLTGRQQDGRTGSAPPKKRIGGAQLTFPTQQPLGSHPWTKEFGDPSRKSKNPTEA